MPYKYVKSTPKKSRKSSTKTRVSKGTYVKVASPEVKFFDSVFPAASVPAGPASLIDSTIVNMVNGVGPSDRIGRKVKITRIDYSLSVLLAANVSGINTEAFRFDIWLDRQANGAAPGPTDLYASTAGIPGTCQFVNILNEKRFKRLHTHVQAINLLTGVGVSNPGANVGYKLEGSIYPKTTLEYDASTGNVTDLTSANIFTAWSSDNGYAYCNAVGTRVHYTDV